MSVHLPSHLLHNRLSHSLLVYQLLCRESAMPADPSGQFQIVRWTRGQARCGSLPTLLLLSHHRVSTSTFCRDADTPIQMEPLGRMQNHCTRKRRFRVAFLFQALPVLLLQPVLLLLLRVGVKACPRWRREEELIGAASFVSPRRVLRNVVGVQGESEWF